MRLDGCHFLLLNRRTVVYVHLRLKCSILVFSVALVCFLVAVACMLCYAMHNKRQQRQKLVPCDAYCTCPAHANHSSHFATRLESA